MRILVRVYSLAAIIAFASIFTSCRERLSMMIKWGGPIEGDGKTLPRLSTTDSITCGGASKVYTYTNANGAAYYNITVQNTGNCTLNVNIEVTDAGAATTDRRRNRNFPSIASNSEAMYTFNAPTQGGTVKITISCGPSSQASDRCSFNFQLTAGDRNPARTDTLRANGWNINASNFPPDHTGGTSACLTAHVVLLQIVNNSDADVNLSDIIVTNTGACRFNYDVDGSSVQVPANQGNTAHVFNRQKTLKKGKSLTLSGFCDGTSQGNNSCTARVENISLK